MSFTLNPLGAKPLLRHKGRYAHLFNPHFIYLFIYFFPLNFELVIKSCITYYTSMYLCFVMSSHHVDLFLGSKL